MQPITEVYQPSERISPELVNGYRPEYAVKAIQLANNRFQKTVDLDDMIDDCLRLPNEGENVTPLSIKQIVEIIKLQYPLLNATHAMKVHLGRHLVQHGFESKIRNTGSVYYAVPLNAA